MKPPDIDNIDDYRRLLEDPDHWHPYITEVCHRHSLVREDIIPRVGIPGTYPVFNVSNRWIIKFFGRLFDGGNTMLRELDAHRIVSSDPDIPVAGLVTHGCLFDITAEWRLPYMVFKYIPGVSLSAVRSELTRDNMAAIVEDVGRIVKRLHSLPVPVGAYLKQNWDDYTRMLANNRTECEKRHRQWCDLPNRIINQIDSFLPAPSDLIPSEDKPTFLHADITADHILVQKVGLEWKIRALIDFGDALVGDPLFELIALHIDLFQCDKELLRNFIQVCQPSVQLDEITARKFLSLCLLHSFNIFLGFFKRHPEAACLTSLEDFAYWLWRVD